MAASSASVAMVGSQIVDTPALSRYAMDSC
jgi:hypothetical protein